MARVVFAGVAVALMLCAPAQAQRSTWRRWPGTERPPASGAPAEERDYRVAGVLVELDLLADSVTCPYGFEAHVEGTTLYLSGSVPNRAVHDQALLIAHQRWPNVVDALNMQGNVITRSANTPPLQLQRAVLQALQQAFPNPGHRFEVRCDAHGRTEIKGFARTFDQKLAVSQRVRQVPGCSCVLNTLRLNPAADQPPPGQTGMMAANAASPWNRLRSPFAGADQQYGARPQTGAMPYEQRANRLMGRGQGGVDLRSSGQSSPYAVIQAAPSKTAWGRPGATSAPAAAVPPVTAPANTELAAAVIPFAEGGRNARPIGADVVPFAEDGQTVRPTVGETVRPTVGETVPPTVANTAPPLVGETVRATEAQPASEPTSQAAVVAQSEQSQVTHATVLLPDEPPPSKATILIPDDDDDKEPPSAEPVTLNERVARACGLKRRDVQIAFPSAKEAVISLPTAQQSVADRWVEKIMQMAEFEGVHLQIQVNAVDW